MSTEIGFRGNTRLVKSRQILFWQKKIVWEGLGISGII
jgi:hypothetical protein